VRVLWTAVVLSALFFWLVPDWVKHYLYIPAGWVAVWFGSVALSLTVWIWIEDKWRYWRD